MALWRRQEDGSSVQKFPFQTELSLQPLYRRLQERIASRTQTNSLVGDLIGLLEEHPELIADPAKYLMDPKCQKFTRLFFSAVYGLDSDTTMLSFGVKPFDLNPVLQTTLFQSNYQLRSLEYAAGMYTEDLNQLYILRACALILNRFYSQEVKLSNPYVFTLLPKDSGLPRYFKPDIKTEYIEIIAKERIKPLNSDKVKELLRKGFDPDEWLKVIDPGQFIFRGLSLVQLVDVTESELLSKIRYQLFSKEVLTHKEQIEDLEWLLRSFLHIEGIQIGISAVNFNRELEFVDQYNIQYDLLLSWRQKGRNKEGYIASVYETACHEDEWQIIDDLTQIIDPGDPEVELLNKGFRSLILIPLKNDSGAINGIMEIAGYRPDIFNAFQILKLKELQPLIEWAVQRRREDVDNKISTIIKDQYTSLHPSVEWKFTDNAFNYLNQIDAGQQDVSIEPVNFRHVFPLYGQADIVGSSGLRNKAIQEDFHENLVALNNLFDKCLEVIEFPLLRQYKLDIQKHLVDVSDGVNPEEESNLLVFFRDRINAVLEQLKGLHDHVDLMITEYQSHINPDFGVYMKKRIAFQKSVTRINERLGNILDKEDDKLQALLPHYFEKYKTDGVHFDIYLGQALLQNRNFSEAYLKNFRLWQLITMCKITVEMNKLKDDLPIMMETAQMIFVYSQPINIHFRMDEKRFDVETSEDTQYEMIKKRIDKAHIADKGERLTQKGKIAIIFTLERDRAEYMEYMEYLEHEGWIYGALEEFILEDFQGVEGLRAIRFAVKEPAVS